MAEIKPDRELITWEKWAKIRRKVSRDIGEKTLRPPIDISMNETDSVRPRKEIKEAVETAQVLKENPPTVRGYIWDQPTRLKQCCPCQPEYLAQRTLAELGKPDIIQYIDVPKFIKVNEKGLEGISQKKPTKKLDQGYNEYRKKREHELQSNLEKLYPFKPVMSDLMIHGVKEIVHEKKIPVPMINVIDEGPQKNIPTTLFALRINNTILTKNEPYQDISNLSKMQKEKWHCDCVSWNYYFATNVNKAGLGVFYLENLGTATIHYCWRKIEKENKYVPKKMSNQVFSFNKNIDVIYPGQIKHIKFTFVTDTVGSYLEYWNFCPTNVELGTFSVVLEADVFESCQCISSESDLQVETYKFAIAKIARSIINELINKSTEFVPEICPYKNYFLEAEMFVMKNPVYFYHQTEVEEMKELYKKILPDSDWDLSIVSWKKAILTEEFENRMANYQKLKSSHLNFLKPWYEGEDLLNQKHRTVIWALNIYADQFFVEYQMLDDIASSNFGNDDFTKDYVKSVFYMRMYEYLGQTIELIAANISTINLNKWINFDCTVDEESTQ